MTRMMIERQIGLTLAALDRATTDTQVFLLKDTLRDLEVMLAKLP